MGPRRRQDPAQRRNPPPITEGGGESNVQEEEVGEQLILFSRNDYIYMGLSSNPAIRDATLKGGPGWSGGLGDSPVISCLWICFVGFIFCWLEATDIYLLIEMISCWCI
ncbi:hypothetical protein GUJ93_ZPchr0013g34979 [Zizania palustris]|uniref:Uncharacterized protein n=1 Tax=Zizania palustris TaxID=103762 RepID=A0A8J6BWT7_ZIZPA|nr:hypothetical protein GUJ93_ZPchr0013g34979 [Zizania palustris]